MAKGAATGSKGVYIIVLAVAMIWLFNELFSAQFGEWSLSLAVGLAMLVMWPVMNHFFRKGRIAGIIFKIDSVVGLKLLDRLGAGHPHFWTGVGNAATVLLFGGFGSAFVAHHVSDKQRQALLGLLSFGAVYAYASKSVFSVYPFAVEINLSVAALGLSLVAFILLFKASGRIGKGKAAIVAFILAFVFFAHPFLQEFIYTGNAFSLLATFFIGIVGLPGYMLLQLLMAGIAFAVGSSSISPLTPSLPAIEGGVAVLKDTGGLGLSIPIFPDVIFALVILLVLHEGFHGLVARAQGIGVKHTGIATISIFPLGAFVEPDEKQFKKESREKQVRVFAVGSFANIYVLAIASFAIGSIMVSNGMISPYGMPAGSVTTWAPAGQFVEPGDILMEIGGNRILTSADFYSVMGQRVPNETVVVITDKGEFNATLIENPSNSSLGYLGVGPDIDRTLSFFSPELMGSSLRGDLLWLFHMLKWLFLINLSVGILNLLPIPIFDGHGVYRNIFGWIEDSNKWAKRKHLARVLMKGFTFIVFIVVFLCIAPAFLR